MKTISRTKCVLTNAEDLDHLYTFQNFPIYMGCMDIENTSPDIFCDMSWGVSKKSGSLQLMNLIDPTVLYTKHHNPGTTGKTWQQHHKKFHDFIKKHGFTNALEIGGASGSLVKLFIQEHDSFQWTIIEPSEQKCTDDHRVNFIQEFFENSKLDKKFDAVIHSHLFEHVYDPLSFLKKTYDILDDNGLQYITIPNMKHWLENGYTNTLMFEHTVYIDELVLEYLLKKSNFEVIDKIIEPHSIFFCCKKSSNVECSLPDLSYVKGMYFKYIENLNSDVNSIKHQIKGNKFYLFGGHIFSQVLLNSGLPENQVINVLDNDPLKQNKRLYGTNLIVKSPRCLENDHEPIVVLRGGEYNQEIKESLLKINPGIKFV